MSSAPKPTASDRTVTAPEQAASRMVLPALMVAYALLAVVLCLRRGVALDGDGTSYLWLASQIVRGHLAESVSGTWSPLLTWGIAGLQMLGVSPIVAGRAVLIVAGLAWGAGVWVMAGRYRLSQEARVASTLVALMWSLRYAPGKLQPDLLVSAFLMLYFVLATHPRLTTRRGISVLLGLVAGVAYLAKAFALPFLLAHYAISCYVRNRTDAERGAPHARGYLLAWVIGTAVAVAVAAPWVAALSMRYGGVRFSTYAECNAHFRNINGVETGKDFEDGICEPRPGAFSAWVDPLYFVRKHPERVYPPMNPRERLQMAAETAARMRDDVARIDWGALCLACLFALPFLLLGHVTQARAGTDSAHPLWTLGTVVVYALGMAIVATGYLERYILPVMPLVVLSAFQLLERLTPDNPESRRAQTSPRSLAMLMLLASLLLVRVPALLEDWASSGMGIGVQDREMARQLKALGAQSPMAGGWDYNRGLYVAFWAGYDYYGVPRSGDPRKALAEMEQGGVRTMLLKPDSSLTPVMRTSPLWREAGRIRGRHSTDVEPTEYLVWARR